MSGINDAGAPGIREFDKYIDDARLPGALSARRI
jgi:hypothetical protein